MIGWIDLTDNDYFDSMPVWSADGSQLVFVSDRDGGWSLYLQNRLGDTLQTFFALLDHKLSADDLDGAILSWPISRC